MDFLPPSTVIKTIAAKPIWMQVADHLYEPLSELTDEEQTEVLRYLKERVTKSVIQKAEKINNEQKRLSLVSQNLAAA